MRAIVVISCLIGFSIVAHAEENHVSLVKLASDNSDTLEGNADGQQALIGRVGNPFKARIRYYVGWDPGGEGGSWQERVRTEINDPEYEMFGKGLSTGLWFSRESGVLEGTPTLPGRWELSPAVRDKVKGESPYRGKGYWWTHYRQYQGKTWAEANDPTVLVVLPASSGKEFRLLCTWKGSRRFLLEIDYEHKLIKRFGDNAKIDGVYSATVDDDFIGWNGMIGKNSKVMLDRKTGQLSLRNPDFPTAEPDTAVCEKRSEAQKF